MRDSILLNNLEERSDSASYYQDKYDDTKRRLVWMSVLSVILLSLTVGGVVYYYTTGAGEVVLGSPNHAEPVLGSTQAELQGECGSCIYTHHIDDYVMCKSCEMDETEMAVLTCPWGFDEFRLIDAYRNARPSGRIKANVYRWCKANYESFEESYKCLFNYADVEEWANELDGLVDPVEEEYEYIPADYPKEESGEELVLERMPQHGPGGYPYPDVKPDFYPNQRPDDMQQRLSFYYMCSRSEEAVTDVSLGLPMGHGAHGDHVCKEQMDVGGNEGLMCKVKADLPATAEESVEVVLQCPEGATGIAWTHVKMNRSQKETKDLLKPMIHEQCFGQNLDAEFKCVVTLSGEDVTIPATPEEMGEQFLANAEDSEEGETYLSEVFLGERRVAFVLGENQFKVRYVCSMSEYECIDEPQ